MDANSKTDLKDCLLYIIQLLHGEKRILLYDELRKKMLTAPERILNVIGGTNEAKSNSLLQFISEHQELFLTINLKKEGVYVALTSRFAYIYSRLMEPLAQEIDIAEENAWEHFSPGKFFLDEKKYARQKVKLMCMESVHDVFVVVTTVLNKNNPFPLDKLVGRFNKFDDTTRLVINYCNGRNLLEKVITLMKYFSKGLKLENGMVSLDKKEIRALHTMLEIDLFINYSKLMIMSGTENISELSENIDIYFERRKFSNLCNLSRQNIKSWLKNHSATFFSPDDHVVKLIDSNIDISNRNVTEVIEFFDVLLREKKQGSMEYKETSVYLAQNKSDVFAALQDKTSLGISQILYLKSDLFRIESGKILYQAAKHENFIYLKRSGLHAMEVDCEPSLKSKAAAADLLKFVNGRTMTYQMGFFKEIAVKSAILEIDFEFEEIVKVEIFCHSDFTCYFEENIVDFTKAFEIEEIVMFDCQYSSYTTLEKPRNWIATRIYPFKNDHVQQDVTKQKESLELLQDKNSLTNKKTLIMEREALTESPDFSPASSIGKKKRKKNLSNPKSKMNAEANSSSENKSSKNETRSEKTASAQPVAEIVEENERSLILFGKAATNVLNVSLSATHLILQDESEQTMNSANTEILRQREKESENAIVKPPQNVPKEKIVQVTQENSEHAQIITDSAVPTATDITLNGDMKLQKQNIKKEALHLLKICSENATAVNTTSEEVSKGEAVYLLENRYVNTPPVTVSISIPKGNVLDLKEKSSENAATISKLSKEASKEVPQSLEKCSENASGKAKPSQGTSKKEMILSCSKEEVLLEKSFENGASEIKSLESIPKEKVAQFPEKNSEIAAEVAKPSQDTSKKEILSEKVSQNAASTLKSLECISKEVEQLPGKRSQNLVPTIKELPEDVSSKLYFRLLQLPLTPDERTPKVNEIRFVFKIIKDEITQSNNLEIGLFPSAMAEEQSPQITKGKYSCDYEQSTKEICSTDTLSHEENYTFVKTKSNAEITKQHEVTEWENIGEQRDSLSEEEIPLVDEGSRSPDIIAADQCGDASEHVRGCPKWSKFTKKTIRTENCQSCEKIKSILDTLIAKRMTELFFYLTEQKFKILNFDTPIENVDKLLLKATFIIPSSSQNTDTTFLNSRHIEIPKNILDEVKAEYRRDKRTNEASTSESDLFNN